jgi:hypothetical protein
MTTVVGYEYFGRPYVLGEAPGPSEGEPMAGIVTFISSLSGTSEDKLRELFKWENLLGQWPGYGPSGGSDFPMEEARRRAAVMLSDPAHPNFIFLGRRVAKAFSWQGDWFVWGDDRVVCPHPSRLNRWWNKSENVAEARIFWRRMITSADLARQYSMTLAEAVKAVPY